MKKQFKRKTAAGILCLGLIMQTAAFFPANAETKGGVTFNEVCTKNTTYHTADGAFYDWIELYNSSKEEADISGWGLSDNSGEPYRYVFPDGTRIPANGRLVVFCDSTAALSNNKIAPFGLSTSGETLLLTDKNGQTAHTVTVGALASDTSYGQYPDGSGEFYTLSCTPDKANAAPEGSAAVRQPVFSKESGYYDNSFELTLTAEEGCTVYYTTDGSNPTTESEKYEKPITIKDMTDTQNRLSARTDISPNKVEEPNKKVDKAAVIRAVSVDKEGRVSDIVTNTYFIGKTNSGYYKDMKVVSLVTDPDNLFDYETGIYCLGKAYDEENRQSDGPRGSMRMTNYWDLIANYSKRGREWERPASLTLFENGEKILEQNVGIRIKGNYSRCLPQKSFNVYARQDYGTPEFDFDFFSGSATKAKNGKAIKKYEGIVLRNGGNDNTAAFFRDSINQKLITDRAFAYQASSECILFIDGEFWGIYQILEKIDKSYLSSHFGVKKSDIAMIKNGELEEGSDADLKDWSDLLKGVIDGKTSYEEFCGKVDIQAYIDYMAAQIYWANADWPQRNYVMWRSDAIDETNPYADGKWRPVLFDTESGQGLYGSNDKSVYADCYRRLRENSDDFSRAFTKLLNNDTFRMDFARTMMDLSNYNFVPEKTKTVINSYKNSFKQQVLDTFERFHSRSMSGANGERTFESAYSTVTDFYANRYSYAERTTRSALKLTSEPHKLTVVNRPVNGSIDLNTLHIGNENKWSGNYHSDYDLTLTAVPSEGKNFSHWKINGAKVTEGDVNSTSIKIMLESDATVEAVYESGVRGDVNSDVAFNVADLIVMQKWISGSKDAELSNWENGDLCTDGVLDIFDIVSMRRELLSDRAD